MKIYLEIDNAAKLHYSFFTFNIQHEFCTQLHILSSGDNNTDSATRSWSVQSLVTHGITDKAAYLSEATE